MSLFCEFTTRTAGTHLPAEGRGGAIGLSPLEVQSGITRPDGPGLAY